MSDDPTKHERALDDLDAALSDALGAMRELRGKVGDMADATCQIEYAFGCVMGSDAVEEVARTVAKGAAVGVMAAQLAALCGHLDPDDDAGLRAIYDIADRVVSECAEPVITSAACAASSIFDEAAGAGGDPSRDWVGFEVRGAIREIESEEIVSMMFCMSRRERQPRDGSATGP